MPVPKITPEQREIALKKAAEMRAKRAAAKSKIEKGELSCAEVFAKVEADDPVFAKMRVKEFVTSFPGYGKVRAASLLERLGINERRRLKGVGTNQKEGLITEIDN